MRGEIIDSYFSKSFSCGEGFRMRFIRKFSFHQDFGHATLMALVFACPESHISVLVQNNFVVDSKEFPNFRATIK